MENTERQFIRHPTAIPLLFKVGDRTETIQAKDVGDGGLCFISQHSINVGEHIHITIPICDPEFEAHGIVRWCKHNGNRYLIGVASQQKSVIFAIRMVEQVCHIKNYRKKYWLRQALNSPMSKQLRSGLPSMLMNSHNY